MVKGSSGMGTVGHSALWVCPDCGFTFDACHEDVAGGYSCPVCGEAAALRQVAELKAAARAFYADVVRTHPAVGHWWWTARELRLILGGEGE